MEQEKFSLSQEDIALSAAIEKLFPIQSLADIQATLADAQLRKPYLKSIETLTKTIHTMSKNLLDLLQENNQREADKEAEKEEQKNFLITEKEVLSSLPETEQQRIGTMRSWLQKEY